MKKLNRKGKITVGILATVVIAVIAVRLALPSMILKNLNNNVSNHIDGYTASATDVDLSLITGSYSLDNVKLHKTNEEVDSLVFFEAEKMFFSLEWKTLLKFEIAGKVVIRNPKLNFIKTRSAGESQISIDQRWTSIIEELMPWQINTLEVIEGVITYHDLNTTPPLAMQMDSISLVAKNLANITGEEDPLPSSVTAAGRFLDARAKLTLMINPFQQTPAFELTAELSPIDLQNLKEFLRAYSKTDVTKGTFELYTEASTRNNKVIGFAVPVVKDIDVTAWNNNAEVDMANEADNSIAAEANESASPHQLVSWTFKDRKKRTTQASSQIDFEGDIEGADVDIWSVIGETLQTAFVKSLIPSVEKTVAQNEAATRSQLKRSTRTPSVEVKENSEKKGGFLKRLFKKKEGKEEKKNKRKKDS
jgi:hypothetical protein